ncbi:MAG: signal peptidase I [Clostridia bacterium]|nr:signal peptidase I [Clostridia bacterium]MDD4375220.1 signal peptidase I [Clostridia bacterium]
MKNKVVKEILDWVICIIIAYIIYIVVNYFFGTVSGVKQLSMFPTSKEGDKLIISRRVISEKPLERGNIVTLESPIFGADMEKRGNVAAYPKYTGLSKFLYKVIGIGKKSYVKRIIALEGEHIFISEEGEVYIDDVLLEETYLPEDLKTPRNEEYYDMIVPEGCVFVMGDNREKSADSRSFGAVPICRIEGNVVVRIWPLNKIGKLGG